jgi:hypothetical protein
MLGKAPILPAAYVGPKKIHGLITGQALIKIGLVPFQILWNIIHLNWFTNFD